MKRTVKAAVAAVILAATPIVNSIPASAHFLWDSTSGTWYPHWDGGGYSNPHIWIKDTTGSQWPVYDVTTNWNNSSYIDTYYQYDSCGGPHCIGVYEYSSSNTDDGLGYAGHIIWHDHYVETGGVSGHPYVELNNYWTTHTPPQLSAPLTATQRKHVACQEIGHAFGLDHQYTDASSCMNDTYPDNLNDTNVGNHSWDDLNTLYNHITGSNPWG